jgi:hypothetical protein
LAFKPAETDRQDTWDDDDFDVFGDSSTDGAQAAQATATAAATATATATATSSEKLHMAFGYHKGVIVYEDDVQQLIATNLSQGEYVFELVIGGQTHTFDFIEMTQTTPRNMYAIRECGGKNRAAFVDLDHGVIPLQLVAKIFIKLYKSL